MMLYRAILHYLVVLLCLALLPSSANAQAPKGDSKNGKTLFLANCASCHVNDMKSKGTGPALGDGIKNWDNFPRTDIYRWIRNSAELVAEKHPRAVAVYTEYKGVSMNPMNLKDAEIEDVLAYIEEKAKGAGATTVAQTTTASTTSDKSEGSSAIWWVLLVVLVFAVAMLGRYINSLNRLAQQKAGEEAEDQKSLTQILFSPGVVRVLTYFAVLFGGYTLVSSAIGLGRQQGYMPEQPIKYSHALHAGKNKIDCQYCHDGARRSKHAVIPSTNTCMNCHKDVKAGQASGTAEIMKIYASAGFNPLDDTFFGDTVSVTTRKATYKQWAKATAIEAKKSEAESDKMSADQVKAAQSFISKPIEWVRIHNLPDHVYFNHAQHVTVGKVACQTCHGQVQEMEVVQQYAPLSMGWCVNCHRQTDVKFTDNQYYSTYERYHNELESKQRKSVKVEDIGGLDCQKCHY